MTDRKPNRARTHAIRQHMADHPGTTYTAAARVVDAAHADKATAAAAPAKPSTVTYGPKQILTHLGMLEWQWERARAMGLVPAADHNGRWSQDSADAIAARLPEIRTKIGELPDVGAWRAAEYLAAKFGTEVTPDAVHEAARRHLIAYAGDYKDTQLFSGRDIEAFNLPEALPDLVAAGERRTLDRAAQYLRVRTADITVLVDLGWLVPVARADGPYGRRGNGRVPLYRTGDLMQLRHDPLIDWDAVRNVRKGGRSPLRALADVDLDVLLARERSLVPGLEVAFDYDPQRTWFARLDHLRVPAERRGERVAEGVMRRTLAWADRRDLPVVGLPTDSEPSSRIRSWYHQHGFDESYAFPGYAMVRPAWSQIPDWRRDNIRRQRW